MLLNVKRWFRRSSNKLHKQINTVSSSAHELSVNRRATYQCDRPVSIKQKRSPVITCCRRVGLSSAATRALRDGQIGRWGAGFLQHNHTHLRSDHHLQKTDTHTQIRPPPSSLMYSHTHSHTAEAETVHVYKALK